MKKLIIIPAYNEEESIASTVHDIQKNSPNFDYVVINDCSKDRTRTICEENHFNFIDLPINLGIGGAVQTGYLYAYVNNYDIAVQVDGDGQHDASFLNDMADYLEQNHVNMVIGSRFIDKEGFQSSLLRRIGIRYFTVLIKICTGHKITDPTSGLRMVDREVIKLFSEDYPKDYPEPETTVTVLMHKLKIQELPVIMRERQGGESSISTNRSIYYMIKVTIAILIARLRKDR